MPAALHAGVAPLQKYLAEVRFRQREPAGGDDNEGALERVAESLPRLQSELLPGKLRYARPSLVELHPSIFLIPVVSALPRPRVK